MEHCADYRETPTCTSCLEKDTRINGLILEVSKLKAEINLIKKESFEMQQEFEKEQEYIANKLLKKIEEMQKDKAEFFKEVEIEEEYLTNSLQKRLVQLEKEKIDLENTLGHEQEYIVNKLQQQLEKCQTSGPSSPNITPRLSGSFNDLYFPSSLSDSFKRENNMLKMKLIENDQKYQSQLKNVMVENENLLKQLYILKKKLVPNMPDDKENVDLVQTLTRSKRSQSMIAKNKPATLQAIILSPEHNRQRSESVSRKP